MKARVDRPTRRCAIYTRKSTDEGLEQSFNSLDAQRDACAAYILSQAHEGWQLCPERYDDGGYSGGSMERPGLLALLADMRSGKIDIIVVYKVDRLTRSLADFAKIVEILDNQGASFVSVTQAFNTTTSMGRLTLNVLLSFAQFEREVTGERIRDKIAASKARGMWMGGVVPLGYEVKDRKLHIIPDEADRVRHIFSRYLALGSVYELQNELVADEIRTKARIGRDGRAYGHENFSRGGLYQMLRNRIYRGEITHRGEAYAGEHKAIIEHSVFEEVQQLLAGNRRDNKNAVHANNPSLLAGLLWDSNGRRMTPAHANKNGVRYRYYISRKDKERLGLAVVRVPAGDLEELIVQQLRKRAPDDAPGAWQLEPPCREKLATLVSRITIHSDRVEIVLTGIDEAISMPATLVSRSGERRIATPSGPFETTRKDPALIKLVIRAHQARKVLAQLGTVSLQAAAERLKVSPAYFSSLLRIAYLDPDITTAILDGRQPAHLNRQHLARFSNLPNAWAAQRQMLGFI